MCRVGQNHTYIPFRYTVVLTGRLLYIQSVIYGVHACMVLATLSIRAKGHKNFACRPPKWLFFLRDVWSSVITAVEGHPCIVEQSY